MTGVRMWTDSSINGGGQSELRWQSGYPVFKALFLSRHTHVQRTSCLGAVAVFACAGGRVGQIEVLIVHHIPPFSSVETSKRTLLCLVLPLPV
jgi:hypothetical protein